MLLKITTCILTFPVREKSTATADLYHKNLSPRFIQTKSTSIVKINKLRFPLLKHPITSLKSLKAIFSLFTFDLPRIFSKKIRGTWARRQAKVSCTSIHYYALEYIDPQQRQNLLISFQGNEPNVFILH